MDYILHPSRVYAPWVWPVANWKVASELTGDEPRKPMPIAKPNLGLISYENLGSFFAAGRSFAMAYFCVYVIHGGEDGFGYPAFGAAKTYSLDWILPLLLRNLLATWLIAGSWDYFLYFSRASEKLHKFKKNPAMPSLAQFKHDSFMTTIATFCGTAVEAFICHLYANSSRFPATIAENPYLTFLLAITTTHWRIPQFYMIHRGMHPWKTKYFPDVGKFLYRHVHSLHHKSHNPTAFSGTSMHPVEATAYYMAAFCILPFNVHVTVPLGCIIDCAVGAWIGHDGYSSPGGGDDFHQVHHSCFDCNYGAQHIPLDQLFGTAAGSKADIKKIWRKHKVGDSGEAGNKGSGYSTHDQSVGKKVA